MTETTPLRGLIESRRSIRRFLPGPVEREKIAACLEAARLAPSAENDQGWRFLVIDDPELKARFARKAFSGIYAPTPVSYTHLRAHETVLDLVCRLLLEKKKCHSRHIFIHNYTTFSPNTS